MKLYIVTFADNSYHLVIKAEDYPTAEKKAIEYIEEHYTWYQFNEYDLIINVCDNDDVIE